MPMSAAEYRESLRRLKPRVFVDGRAVASVADEPSLQPGVNAVGLTYDFALRDDTASLMRVEAGSGGAHNRMLHVPYSEDELLQKLEAVRLICRYTGCAQRYLVGDAMAGILQGAAAVGGRVSGTSTLPQFALRERLVTSLATVRDDST